MSICLIIIIVMATTNETYADIRIIRTNQEIYEWHCHIALPSATRKRLGLAWNYPKMKRPESCPSPLSSIESLMHLTLTRWRKSAYRYKTCLDKNQNSKSIKILHSIINSTSMSRSNNYIIIKCTFPVTYQIVKSKSIAH